MCPTGSSFSHTGAERREYDREKHLLEMLYAYQGDHLLKDAVCITWKGKHLQEMLCTCEYLLAMLYA